MPGVEDWWQRFECERVDNIGDIFNSGETSLPCFVRSFDDWCRGDEGGDEGKRSVVSQFSITSIAFQFVREVIKGNSPCSVWLQGLGREGKVRQVRDLRLAHQTGQSQIGLIYWRVLNGFGVLEIAGDNRQVPCL